MVGVWAAITVVVAAWLIEKVLTRASSQAVKTDPVLAVCAGYTVKLVPEESWVSTLGEAVLALQMMTASVPVFLLSTAAPNLASALVGISAALLGLEP